MACFVRAGVAALLAAWMALPAARAAAAEPDAGADESAACAVSALLGEPLADAELDALLERLPRCQHHAAWLAALGHQLNMARRFGDAANIIERALLIDPDQKGVRVDYAIALAGTGDELSARALLSDILAEPDVPPGLRAVLMRQRRMLDLPSSYGWHASGSVGLRVGHDSNLLGAPNLDSLTLTLGSQLVEVLLDEAYRSRPGSYRQTDATLVLLHASPGGSRWQAAVGLRDRKSPAVPEADSRQAEAVLEYSGALLGTKAWRGYAVLAAGELRAGFSDYSTRTLVLGAEPRWATECETRLGLEVQSRDYRSNPVLSGRYSGLAATTVCAPGFNTGEPYGQTLWSVRIGSDRPLQTDRPGGRQTQTALRFASNQPRARWQPGAPGYWLLDMELSHQKDSQGYSPILESGRSRVIVRGGVRLEFRWSLTAPAQGRLEPAIGVDAVVQRSNLPLFGLRSWGPYLALRGRW